MFKEKDELRIPASEKRFINPDLRQKLFTEIYTLYGKKFEIKLLYAYLNFDPEVIVDYCVIYSARNDSDTADLILFDIPPIHSDRSTPGYRYCKRTKKTTEFFNYGIDHMVVMERAKFNEFIVKSLELSLDKNSDLYWKKPEHYKDLLQSLLDMSLMYKTKK